MKAIPKSQINQYIKLSVITEERNAPNIVHTSGDEDTWKSGGGCHPRSRLGSPDDACEDISCNIMPPPCTPPPPINSQLSNAHADTGSLFFFLSPNMMIFIFQTDRKNARRLCCCGQPCGCRRAGTRGIVYTKGLDERVPDNLWVTEKRDRPDMNRADQVSWE